MSSDTALDLFRIAFGAVMGGIFGSFATMLAYRVPRRLSIITPRSHCPQCKTPLGAGDLVPVFSYLFSGGRCRHCKEKISFHYLVLELVFVLLGIALSLLFFKPVF